MSTLTKIFVILLAIFCIAFTMSTISFVAQTHDWRSLATAYQQEVMAADTERRNAEASCAAQLAQDRDVINAHLQRISELTQENQRAAREIADAKADKARAEAEIASLQASVRQLTGELAVGQAGWAEMRKQRSDLEQRNIELERRNIDLNERVNEQTAQLMVYEQEKRRLEQQVHMLREENRGTAQYGRTSGGGAGDGFETVGNLGGGRVTPATPAAVSPIRGRILEVSGTLATLSVGSADGVVEDMEFIIYRNDNYIGDLRVLSVEPNKCAARIERSRNTPQVSDLVADASGFGIGE